MFIYFCREGVGASEVLFVWFICLFQALRATPPGHLQPFNNQRGATGHELYMASRCTPIRFQMWTHCRRTHGLSHSAIAFSCPVAVNLLLPLTVPQLFVFLCFFFCLFVCLFDCLCLCLFVCSWTGRALPNCYCFLLFSIVFY